jgi:hypothetical protein
MLPLADFAADRIRRSPEWRCPSPLPTPTGDRHGRCRSPRLSVTTHKVCNVGGVSPSCHRRTAWLSTSRNNPVIYRFGCVLFLISPSCRRRGSWPGSPPFGVVGWVSGGGSAPVAAVEGHGRGHLRSVRWGGCRGGGSAPVAAVEGHGRGHLRSVRWGGCREGGSAPVAAVEGHGRGHLRSVRWGVWSGGGSAPVAAVETHVDHPLTTAGRGWAMGWAWPGTHCAHPLSGRRSRREREEEEAYATSPPRTVELSLDLRPFGGTPPSGATLRKLSQKAATESFVNSPQVMETTGSGDQRR